MAEPTPADRRRHAACLARAMRALNCPILTVGFGAYEDSTDVVRWLPTKEANPLTAQFAQWLDTWPLTKEAFRMCGNTNEGSTGIITIDFVKGEVRADTYYCEYRQRTDDVDDDPNDPATYVDLPEGAKLPQFASGYYKFNRYYTEETRISSPDAPVFTFDGWEPSEAERQAYVAGVDGVIATAPVGVLADYLEDEDARTGPTYPALAAAVRASKEVTDEFQTMGSPQFPYWLSKSSERRTNKVAIGLADNVLVLVVVSDFWQAPAPGDRDEQRFLNYRTVNDSKAVLLFCGGGKLRVFSTTVALGDTAINEIAPRSTLAPLVDT